MTGSLTPSAAARKATPLAEGCLWYFPAALMAVARVSVAGCNQHTPGQPIHHARGISGDHADALLRHLIDAGKIDDDGIAHTAKMAWRALALLQEEIERSEGAPLPRNARLAVDDTQGNTSAPPSLAEVAAASIRLDREMSDDDMPEPGFYARENERTAE